MQGFVVPDSDRINAVPSIGRPVIRKGPDPVKPNLPQGFTTDPNPAPARLNPGLPAEVGMPDKWERATKADLAALGVSGPYLINRKTGDVKLVDVPKVDPAAKPDASTTIAELTNVIDKASKARKLSKEGWFATGFGADIAKKMGGTTAADVQGLLDTIGANTAFTRLQQMRQSSPTGGALGSITERELALLQSTIASLNQGQGDAQFQQAMQDVINAYGNVLLKIPGGRKAMIERGYNLVSPKRGSTPQPAKNNLPSGWSVEVER